MIIKIIRPRITGTSCEGVLTKPPPKTDEKKMNNSRINILYPNQVLNTDVFINK